MIRWIAALVVGIALGASVAFGQSNVATHQGKLVQLRALDTITGEVTDIDLPVGETTVYERLMISALECRYPRNNPSSDAFAHLSIRDVRQREAAFEGWMVASSPAISALEHPRYDVWVLRCRKDLGE